MSQEASHSEKQRVSRSKGFPWRNKKVASALNCLADKGRMRIANEVGFFWYGEIGNFKNYLACFVLTLENFSYVSI